MRFFTALASVLALLSFVLVSPAAAQTTCDNAQGLAALQTGDYSEAITAYSCVIDADPLNTEAYLGRAQANLLSGAWYDAYADFVASDEFGQGDGSSFSANFDQANAWILAQPDQPEGYILRAWQYWFWAADSEALDDYERILRIEPDNLFALCYQSSSLNFLGEPIWEDGLSRALELAPDNPNVLTMAGRLYQLDGQQDQAFLYLNRAPDFAPAVSLHGEVNFDLQRYPSAQRDYLHVLDLHPTPEYTMRAYEGLGKVALELDLRQEAADAFAQADAVYGDSANVALRIAFDYSAFDPALEAFWFYEFASRAEVRSGASEPLVIGTPLHAPVARGMVTRYPITLMAGATLRFSVASISAESVRVDPLIVLLAPDGTPLRGSDDAEFNVNMGAQIDNFIVPEDGVYTLVVTSTFYGNTGTVAIDVSPAD
ncbi:MAG: tetratricopeptide repeat protein [Anaerolinea sp.]|nr:tetratricopeptide repeat protein [Anaerolinea sp.]